MAASARVSFATLEVAGPPSAGPPSATARSSQGNVVRQQPTTASWGVASVAVARQSSLGGQQSLPRRQSVEQLVDQGHRRSEASQMAVNAAALEAVQAAFIRIMRCIHFVMLLSYAGFVFGLGYAAYCIMKAENLSCSMPLVESIFIYYCILFAIGFKRSTLAVFLWPQNPDERDSACPACCYGCILHLCLLIWPGVTAILWYNTEPCERKVLDATELLLILSTLQVVFGIVLPSCFVCVVITLARRGAISAPDQGAPEGFMDELPTIDFRQNAALFNDDAAGGFGTSCAICMSDFDGSTAIVCTPCPGTGRGHAFHKDCLAGWLRMARTCPLCRTDLVQAIRTAQQGMRNA